MFEQFRSQDLLQLLRNKLHSTFGELSAYEKCLYAQHDLLQLMNFVFDLKLEEFLQKHSIQHKYEFEFEGDVEDEKDDSAEHVVVFFLRPSVRSMRSIASMVLGNQSRNIRKEYFVLLSPKKTFLCLDQLEALKVSSFVKVLSFNFDLLPLERNVLSMELPRAFRKHFVQGDQTVEHLVSESVLRLENALGTFEHHFAKGDSSVQILEMIKEKYSQEKFEKRESDWEISLFLFDRTADLVTPMLTPFSYEGLLDTVYPIEQNQITVPGKLINAASNQPTPYQIISSQDEMYPIIRGMYINFAVQLLREKCKQLNDQIKQATQNELGALEKIAELQRVKDTKGKQYTLCQNHLSLAINLSERINRIDNYNRLSMEAAMMLTGNNSLEALEELSVLLPLETFLRLVALASAVLGGIRDKTLRMLEQIVVRSYGMEHVLTLRNLQVAGIIQSYINKGNWNDIKNRFYLINENVDLRNPNDYSYIFILYASLLTRMVEEGLSDPQAWSKDKEKYAMVRGATHSYRQSFVEFPKKNRPKLAFVYFVGGVTYSEIASLRFVALKLRTQIVVCATHITSGDRLISECVQTSQA